MEDDWVHVERVSGLSSPKQNSSKMSEQSFDPGLPRPNPTVSSWQLPPSPLRDYRSSESLPLSILDVVIIGSGMSGTSVAWHLLHSDGAPKYNYYSALMLEAREVCSGATGRNGTLHFALQANSRRSLIM
jgi:FAD dependent oxidoreductase